MLIYTTRNEDIKKALESCKQTHDFLFGSNEPINNANVGPTQGSAGKSDGLEEMKRIMGIKDEK